MKPVRITYQGMSKGHVVDAEVEALLALYRASPQGGLPVAEPASNGIQPSGNLRFTDWRGEIVEARPGDVIEVTDAGWALVQPEEES